MRRPKRTYIRLAAFFASQPAGVNCIRMSLSEIEEVIDERLPEHARFPFWWHNEPSNVHSRAWLSSDWHVACMDKRARTVEFRRGRPPDREIRLDREVNQDER